MTGRMLAALAAILVMNANVAQAQINLLAKQCPGNAAAEITLPEQNAEQDRAAAREIAAQAAGRKICLLGWVDATDGGISTRMLIRRIGGISDTLTMNGVQPLRISNELRPIGAATRNLARQVQIIFYR